MNYGMMTGKTEDPWLLFITTYSVNHQSGLQRKTFSKLSNSFLIWMSKCATNYVISFVVYDGFIGKKIFKLCRQESCPFGPAWATNTTRIWLWTFHLTCKVITCRTCQTLNTDIFRKPRSSRRRWKLHLEDQNIPREPLKESQCHDLSHSDSFPLLF